DGGEAARRRGGVHRPISAAASNTIEGFAGLQMAFRDSDHFARGRADGRYCRIVMNDRAADSRGKLNVRQMVRRVEDVERAITKLVIGELDLLQRHVLVNDHKSSGER